MFGFFDKLRGKKALPKTSGKTNQSKPVATYGYWDGTIRDGSRQNHPFQVSDADSTHSNFTRLELISISRKLYDNDGYVGGAIDYIADNAFPLTIQSASDDPVWNEEADEYFNDWCDNHADIKGEATFDMIQGYCSRDIDRDGDLLPIFTNHPSGIPALQLVEAHRIDSSGLDNPSERWSEGVFRNRHGRPRYYAVTEPGKDKPRIIPSFSAMLLKEPKRTLQNRGIPACSRALAHVRDKKEILGFEKLKVKNLSSLLPYIESDTGPISGADFGIETPDTEEEPELPGSKPFDLPVKKDKVPKQKVFGGEVDVLERGQTLKQLDNKLPSPTFTGFLEFLLREFAMGVKLPFEIVINPKGPSGPAFRSLLGRAQKTLNARQRTIGRFCKRTRNYVIADAINQGRLKAVNNWHKTTTLAPARLSIDAGREAQQEREDFRAGLDTMRDNYGRRGRNWKKDLKQIALEAETVFHHAQELKRKTGMPIEWCLDRISVITPNGILIQPNSDTSKED